MTYYVDFINPTTNKVVTTGPFTHLGGMDEQDLIKCAKDVILDDGLSTEEELKSMQPQIRQEK